MFRFTALFVFLFLTAGCANERPMPQVVGKFYADSPDNKEGVAGDIPRVGQEVRVVGVCAYETPGPYVQVVVWRTSDHKTRVLETRGQCFSGLEGYGSYFVKEDVSGPAGIRFLKIR